VSPAIRNSIWLAAGLVCLSGMIQLAVALGTVTLVAVTGIESILGLGPAVFLIAGALAVAPAGRLSDRFGRMPIIRGGFVLGILGPAATALGCWWTSGFLVFVGLALCGASSAIVLLSRAAAAEMFPPERRARGMSFVLFAAVSGAIFGPLVFGPLFADRALTPEELALPWLGSSAFALAGLIVSFGVRTDPKTLSQAFVTRADPAQAAPLAQIVRRPGVRTALGGAVASFAVMVGVMNLATTTSTATSSRSSASTSSACTASCSSSAT
jgi:MFS family permease